MPTPITVEQKARALGIYGAMGVLLLSLYAVAIQVMRYFNMLFHKTIYTTIGSLLLFGAALFYMVWIMPFPLKYFGFKLGRLKHDVLESIMLSIVFCAIITLIKWSITMVAPGLHAVPVLDVGGLYKVGMGMEISHAQVVVFSLLYSAFVPLQMFIMNGAVQSPLMYFMPNKHASLIAVFVATIFFCAIHIALDFVYALAIAVPAFFWALLYDRQRSLIGVSISHMIIGVWGLFILGYGHFFAVLAQLWSS